MQELIPKRGAASVAWAWCGYEKSDTEQKTRPYHRNNPLLPPMQQSCERVWRIYK